MARIQILELPTEHHGDDMTTPYLLIIDQAPRSEASFEALRQDLKDPDLVARTGARAVLCFEDTIDIPANEVTVDDGQTYPVTFQVLPDFTEFRAQVAAELQATQERLSSHIRAQVDEELRLAAQRTARGKRGPEPTPRPARDSTEHSHPDATANQP